MSRYQSIVTALAERMRRKELSHLVYFHADHFEPWSEVNGEPAVGQATVDRVGAFVDACNKLDFARRLTLFYKANLNYELSDAEELIRADPDDLIGFVPTDPEEAEFGKAAMGGLVANSRHEIQLHIHHEYYTTNRGHIDPASIEYFSRPGAGTLDGRRLELAIRLNREIIVRETGITFDRWFFVHGQWALNASDDEACRITREIEILKHYGCLGDFTFPAGRGEVDPALQYPYFCKPVNAPKGYDLPAAEPEAAWGNARAAREKFFIWSSPAKAPHCAIDYYSETTRRRLDDVERFATDLVELSYRAGGRIFIKTHAHSVHSHYFDHITTPVFPQEYPGFQAAMAVILEAATRAGLTIDFLSASEVYDLFVKGDNSAADAASDTIASESAAAAHAVLEAIPAERRRGMPRDDMDAAFAIPLRDGADAASPIEFVREVASRTLRQRIETHGVTESGAYRHYASMLDSSELIPRYERAILDLLRDRLPPMTECHEIGSGIGTLAFLLVMSGYTALGIEKDPRRHASAEAVLRELAKDAPRIEDRCKLVEGAFPQSVEQMDVSQACAIVTDFISTQKPAQLDLIVAGLRRYRYVLMDMQRFSRRRDLRPEQLELLADLTRRGFGPCTDTIDLGEEGFYCLFENEAPPFEPDWIRRNHRAEVQALKPSLARRVKTLLGA